jgi:hypothetical protein
MTGGGFKKVSKGWSISNRVFSTLSEITRDQVGRGAPSGTVWTVRIVHNDLSSPGGASAC